MILPALQERNCSRPILNMEKISGLLCNKSNATLQLSSARSRPSGIPRHIHLGVPHPIPPLTEAHHSLRSGRWHLSMEQKACFIVSLFQRLASLKNASPFPFHAHPRMEKGCPATLGQRTSELGPPLGTYLRCLMDNLELVKRSSGSRVGRSICQSEKSKAKTKKHA